MKVTFDKQELIDIIIPAMCATSNKKDNPATECIRIQTTDTDECVITAYDTEKGFQAKIKSTIQEPGEFLLNAQKFLAIIRMMPGDITITIGDNLIATITSGKSIFEMHAMTTKNFPNTPRFTGEKSFAISQICLRKIINQTFFSVAEDNQRLQLNGAYFTVNDNSMKVVALDGLRFAMRYTTCEVENHSVNADEPFHLEFIIPKKSLIELMKLISDTEKKVLLIRATRHMIFNIDGVLFFCRLIEGEYVPYERYIPTNCPVSVRLKTELLRSALERALLVTEDKIAGQVKSYVKLNFEDNLLRISSTSINNKFYDEIEIEKTGDNIEIGFNCRLLLDTFKVLEADEIIMQLSTPHSSVTMEPVEHEDNSDFLYFVFPIRMKS